MKKRCVLLALIVTAAAALHVCLRQVDAATIYRLVNQERITTLCAAPTVLIAIASGPEEGRLTLRRGVRVATAGAPPAAGPWCTGRHGE